MEKLELKHLSAYLPYGLYFQKENVCTAGGECEYKNKERGTVLYVQKRKGKILSVDTNHLRIKTKAGSFDNLNPIVVKVEKWVTITSTFKPILRPLSDLTEEYLMDSNLGILDQIELERLKEKRLGFHNVAYPLAVHLFENHFDVFGLIEKGLAISIHDIKKI